MDAGIAAVTEVLRPLSEQYGIPLDQLKFLLCFFSAYPLAAIYNFLPTSNTTVRHLYGMILGLLMGYFCLEKELVYSFGSSLVCYFLLTVLDIKSGMAHKAVFAFSMLFLSACHLYRMHRDYMGWSMDFTGPQMLLTLKLTTLAFDLYDGTQNFDKLGAYQKEMHVKQLPNLFEFIAYVYFFPGFLAGPAFNYKEYISFIDGSMFKATPNGRAPSPYLPALKKFLLSFVLMGGVLLGGKFPFSFELSPEFAESSFLFKCYYIWIAALMSRFPYYFAWVIAEGACNLCGIGFSGYDGNKNPKWERATNVHVLGLELAQNFRGVTESWNIRTDKWLKHYIYERVSFARVAMTFLCSAVWHGFYGGYYLSFMSAAFIIESARTIRRNIQSRFVTEEGKPKSTKIFYDAVCLVGTSFVLNYLMTPFKMLSFWSSLQVWISVYFIGHILTAAALLVAIVVGTPRRAKPATTTSDKAKAH